MGFNFKAFKRIRHENKITTIFLAEKLKVNRRTIYNWENGLIIPSKEMINKIARILKVPTVDLKDIETMTATQNKFLDSATQTWISLFEDADEYNNTILKASGLIADYSRKLNNATLLLQGIAATLPFPAYLKNFNNKYLMINQALYEYYCLNKKLDYSGKTDFDLLSITEARANRKEDNIVLKTGTPVNNREGYIPGTKKKKTGLITKTPIISKDGEVSGLLGIFIDITERKQTEEKLKVFIKTLNSIEEIIWIAKKAENRKTGSIEFSDFLNNTKGLLFKKIFTDTELELPTDELYKLFNSHIINYHDVKNYNVEKLIKKERMSIHLTANGLKNKNYNIKSEIYYKPENDFFVVVSSEDIEKNTAERIAGKLRKEGVDEDIIARTTDIL